MSRRPSPEPKVGNQPSPTANTEISRIAPTKDGMAANTVSRMRMARSANRPLLSAATMPAVRPTIRMIAAAIATSPIVTGKRSPITVDTSCLNCRERPRSPRKMPPTQFRYCCHGGRSSPNCALISATASGLGLRPRSRKLRGSPGTMKREKKTSSEARNSVSRSAPSFDAMRRAMVIVWPPGSPVPRLIAAARESSTD